MINTNMREVATAAVSTLEVNNMNEFETAATKQNKTIANSLSSSNIVS